MVMNYYTDEKYVPEGLRVFDNNCAYFGGRPLRDDSETKRILMEIDKASYVSPISFTSVFNGVNCTTNNLSNGCKTALNVLYNPECCFNLNQSGTVAVGAILKIPDGNVLLNHIPVIYGDRPCRILVNGDRMCETLEEFREVLSEIFS